MLIKSPKIIPKIPRHLLNRHFSISSIASDTAYNTRQQLESQAQANFLKSKQQLDRLVEPTRRKDIHEENAINFNDPLHLVKGLNRLRVVPKQQAFYMMNSSHEELMRSLTNLVNKHINVPLQENYVKRTWMPFEKYKMFLGNEGILRPTAYRHFTQILARLDAMDPELKPENVQDLLHVFKEPEEQLKTKENKQKIATLDEFGRAVVVGKRKTASAKVQMVESTETHKGQILVNSKHLEMSFPRLQDRLAIMYPLKVVESVGRFNIFATVSGGGISGQASAVAHGIAKALVVHNPLLRTRLSRAKCLRRDSREKERKKPGKPKARKSYTWVKR